jgi:Platelet-activating factor acetylhydrolase, isoform II
MNRIGTTAAIVAPTILAAIQLSAAASRADAPAPFELPSLTGRYAVGTTTWRLIDRSRPETFAASGGFRNVEVLAWYPAAGPLRGRPAPYLREGLAEVRSFATLFGVPETAFDVLEGVRTRSQLDAAPAATPRKYPVLLFSHGYTGIPSAYTGLLEDLASHGYAVLSVVHPYEASAATLADGGVVTLLGKDGKLLPAIGEVFGEWEPEDRTMADVTRAGDDREQTGLLRGYLTTLHRTDIALRRWVDDTKLVLDRLASLAPGSAAGRLAARLDTGRVGVFGHSMGGVTAGQFCVEDSRCRAGLNLDGIPQYGTMIDRSMPRPFLMVYSARPGRSGASDAIYRRAAHPYYRVDVRDTRHLDFSDMAFWGGPLRERPVLGAIAPARVSEISSAIVRQYFDQELSGQRSPLLAGSAVFPEVTVRTVAPLAR